MLRRNADESSYEYVDMSKSGRKRRMHKQIQLHLGTIKEASIKAPKKKNKQSRNFCKLLRHTHMNKCMYVCE